MRSLLAALAACLSLIVATPRPADAACVTFSNNTLLTADDLNACFASFVPLAGGTVTGPLTLTYTGQHSVQNGSWFVGNDSNFASSFQTTGQKLATFNRIGSHANDLAGVSSTYQVTHTGGSGAIPNVQISTTVTSSPISNTWGLFSTLSSASGAGALGGLSGHAAGYLQAIRTSVSAGSTTIDVASSGVSVHVADINGFTQGYWDSSHNPLGGGYPVSTTYPLQVKINGNIYWVTAVTPDTVGVSSGPGTLTIDSSLSGSDGDSGKTVVAQNVGSNLWGSIFEYVEQVDAASAKSGYGTAAEFRYTGNGIDDGDRRALQRLVLARYNAISGSDLEVGNGIGIFGDTHAWVKRAIQVSSPFSQAALDLRTATAKSVDAHAIWLADNQDIALNTSTPTTLGYDTANTRLAFKTGSGAVWWVTGAGTVNAATAYQVAGTQVVGARSTGWTAPTGTASKATFDTATVTTANLAQFVYAMYTALAAHGLVGP